LKSHVHVLGREIVHAARFLADQDGQVPEFPQEEGAAPRLRVTCATTWIICPPSRARRRSEVDAENDGHAPGQETEQADSCLEQEEGHVEVPVQQ
jgi:hypothetical protein